MKATLAEEIAEWMRRLYRQRLTTTSGGNISARDGDAVWMTPGSTDKATMQAADIGAMRLDGTLLTAGFRPTCEAQMHLAIYRARPDVRAVVHAHPVTASAFAAAECAISERLLAETYVVVGKIGRSAYHKQGTDALAQSVAEALAECNTILLPNHGALAVGDSLLQAFDRLEVLENAAQATLICEHLLKAPARHLTPEQLKEL